MPFIQKGGHLAVPAGEKDESAKQWRIVPVFHS